MPISVKFQITFPEPLMAQLRRESKRQKISVAELVRQTMQDQLHRQRSKNFVDPFAWMDGLIDSGETDLASRVDEIYDE